MRGERKEYGKIKPTIAIGGLAEEGPPLPRVPVRTLAGREHEFSQQTFYVRDTSFLSEFFS